MKRFFARHKLKLIVSFLTVFVLIVGNHLVVGYSSSGLIFSNQAEIEHSEYGLLLGTPKHLPDGSTNNYYKNRILATVILFNAGKVDTIIISADSSNKYGEDEVGLIKSDLISLGIDESILLLDKKGNSTWNSILNAKEMIGNEKLIVISQEFHLERAIYIASRKNVTVSGYIAKGKMSNKLLLREVMARVKMQLDLLFN